MLLYSVFLSVIGLSLTAPESCSARAPANVLMQQPVAGAIEVGIGAVIMQYGVVTTINFGSKTVEVNIAIIVAVQIA